MKNKFFLQVTACFFVCNFLCYAYAQDSLEFEDPEASISMDFKDASLKDILKLFSIQSGKNFIASEAVQERNLTLYLDKVPLKDAMDKLFKANNLYYEPDKDSNVIIVKDWGKPQVDTVTKVFHLKYAQVKSSSIRAELKSELKASGGGGESGGEDSDGISEAVKKNLSEYGSVIEDARTNSLIVTDIPSRMGNIASLIASLDTSVSLVMLEVEMLDVSKNAVDELGVKWPQSIMKLDVVGSRTTNFPFFSSKAGNQSSHFLPSVFTAIGAELALDFLRTRTDTKYLARPRIMTLNNQTAEIKITTNEVVGEKVTITAGDSGTTTVEAERYETGVSLRVTPQVVAETGEITLFIVPKVSEATESGVTSSQGITYWNPEVRSTKSIVRLKNEETVIIGGLIRNELQETKANVPILSDIPILGALFRNKSVSKNKERELLVFITPHIIKDSGSPVSVGKTVVLGREQDDLSVGKRKGAISASLDNFEKLVK